MKVPTFEQAVMLIEYAGQNNPGEWIERSHNVAKAIASKISGLDHLCDVIAMPQGLCLMEKD